jgi:carbamoylphosphate synthase small subunit
MQVGYLSPIMRSQALVETTAYLNTYAAAGQMIAAGAPPDVMDNFRHDEIVRSIAKNQGMDLEGLESVDTRDMVREMRAKQEAMQQQLDQLSQGAEAVGKAMPALAQAQQDQGGAERAA